MIRIRCPNPKCRKPLGVKDSLAGRKVACPVCKKPLIIPAPKAAPADVESFATQALADAPKEQPKPKSAAPSTVDFNCPYCDEALHLKAELAGTQHPCPECRRIIKVPDLKVEKPKDWREVAAKGAAAYLKAPKDEIAGVQGDVHSKVSAAALKEAGAIEQAPPPVNIRARVRRIAWAAGIVLGLTLAVFGIYKARSGAVAKRVIASTLAEITKPECKAPPLVRAELLRGVGNLELRQGRRKEALEAFLLARSMAAGEVKTDPVGHDLFLMSLALDQVGLGGSDDDVLHNRRYGWEKVLLELKETIEKIRSPDAQGWTARTLGTRLAAAGKPEMAVQLALGNRDPSKDARVKMLQVALILNTTEEGNIKFAHELLPPPDKSRPLNGLARAAYAEGSARQGKLDDAERLVKERGSPLDRLEAALAVSWALNSDPKSMAPFVDEAVKAAAELKKGVPAWSALQLIRLAGIVEIDKAIVASLVDTLPAHLQERGKLEALRAGWTRSQQTAEATPLRDFRDKTSLWAQGCFHLVRHNARLGQKPPSPAGDPDEAILKIVMPMANLLGESDRNR